MRIPSRPLLIAALCALAPAARPEEPNPDVVKAIRAMLDTKKEDERDAMKAELLKRPDLDWRSFRAGLEAGPYLQKPLETAFGERSSKGNFDIVCSGPDGKPRGFLMWVPKKYDAKEKLPVLFYLHHDPQAEHLQAGGEKASSALARFKDIAEERGMFVVAPYTSRGAEWWTPEGKHLVEWTLKEVRRRYSVDDDRIALIGALGGGDAVWYLGQEMPGTWSSLMPMTGDPYEITAVVRPLFLATLDRMDILMGIPGRTISLVGEKNAERYLADLKPMFDQRMRITTAIWPTAQGDFSYLDKIAAQIGSFACDRKRSAYADEVDVETEAGGPGLRSLWLRNEGYSADGIKAPQANSFNTTYLRWTPPDRKSAEKKLGVEIEGPREGMPGIVLRSASGEAGRSQVYPGDVLLEIDGSPIGKLEDVRAALDKVEWESEVHLLIARDIKEDDLPQHERTENRYRRYRAKMKELKDAGKPVPDDLWDEVVEEGSGEEEASGDGEETGGISISDDSEKPDGAHGGVKAKDVKKVVRIVERWVKIRRPGGVLVREDFGAQWDPSYRKTEGLRIASVYPGSLAARSGFKDGDLIVAVGGKAVRKFHDVEDALNTIDDGEKPFRFEEEPDGENFIEFTIRRPNSDGSFQADTGLTVRWVPVKSSRVDGRWEKKEKECTLYILANEVSGFTLYFNEDLVEPGKEFNLFINDVPYQDLVDPETAPDYPNPHDDPAVGDEVYRMRKKRAKVEGWTPDFAWALEEFLTHWDRRQIYGAKRTFDLTKMKPGFEKARARVKREDDLPERVTKAYEEHRDRAKG
ncbi:MAG TPA: PDZ domain-containing protein [Planctomycetota bacterium]|nr:PDZ domain-containing protein [Planctomycetota bacterium]